jgi:hypothetical protein
MRLGAQLGDPQWNHLFADWIIFDKSLRLINGEAIFKTEISYFCTSLPDTQFIEIRPQISK